MGPTFILNDSVVVGVDARRRLFKLFSRGDGEHVESFRYQGSIGGDVPVVAGMVVAPSMEFEDGFTSVLIWDPGEGSFRYIVDLPEPYMRSLKRNGPFAGTMLNSSVLAWPDTMLVGMAAVNELYLATWEGEVRDTIRPPPVSGGAVCRTACVDGFVPYANELRARLTVSRDTLFLLDRTLNETEDGLKTWIRLYEIDTSRCVWLPTG